MRHFESKSRGLRPPFLPKFFEGYFPERSNGMKKVMCLAVVLLCLQLCTEAVADGWNEADQALAGMTLYANGMIFDDDCVVIAGESFCLDPYNCTCSKHFNTAHTATVAFRVSVVKIDGNTYFRIIDGEVVPTIPR
jgi:hypothetical protein